MSRERILGKVRAALSDGPPLDERKRSVAARLGKPVRHPLPERIAKSPEDLTKLFATFLRTSSAQVMEVASADEIPSAVTTYLREHNLPQRLRHGEDAYLAALPWSKEPTLERRPGRADAHDEVSLSHASAGVAETGTLVMASGPDNPVTLNFLPETHIVVVEEKDIVGPYEDALAKITESYGKGKMPRTVNMIGGPSRTGDIGGRLIMGAHGPRRMCVIIVRGRS